MNELEKIPTGLRSDIIEFLGEIINDIALKINRVPLKAFSATYAETLAEDLYKEYTLEELIIDKQTVDIDTISEETRPLYDPNELPIDKFHEMYLMKYKFTGDPELIKVMSTQVSSTNSFLILNNSENWVGVSVLLNINSFETSKSNKDIEERLAFGNVNYLNKAIKEFNKNLLEKIQNMVNDRLKKAEFVAKLQ